MTALRGHGPICSIVVFFMIHFHNTPWTATQMQYPVISWKNSTCSGSILSGTALSVIQAFTYDWYLRYVSMLWSVFVAGEDVPGPAPFSALVFYTSHETPCVGSFKWSRKWDYACLLQYSSPSTVGYSLCNPQPHPVCNRQGGWHCEDSTKHPFLPARIKEVSLYIEKK